MIKKSVKMYFIYYELGLLCMIVHYTGRSKKPTKLSMVCRTANWSLLKEEPLSGNARFVCCRASEFENEWVSQFVPIIFVSQYSKYATLWPSADFDRNVRNHVNVTYANRWIGRGGLIPWTAWPPDLTTLHHFLWSSMQSMVYVTPATSEEDVIAQVHGAIESLTRHIWVQ